MPNYIIYDGDGNIIKSVNCPASMIALQAAEGQSYLEVAERVDDAAMCVVDGEIVAKE